MAIVVPIVIREELYMEIWKSFTGFIVLLMLFLFLFF